MKEGTFLEDKFLVLEIFFWCEVKEGTFLGDKFLVLNFFFPGHHINYI